MSGRPAASRKDPVAPPPADGAASLDRQTFHTRDLRDIALAIGRDMNLVQDAPEDTVSEWHGALLWLAAYAERIAEVAERDAEALRKGGAA
ncbi:hypothetical protein GLI01_23650 [Gluconacetobacter liquefaciens]|uniref:DUF3077 family protein n=1 Tax=Gluconacetobacter liquefaciens TaxID=89584 RepID=A0A370G6K0_GLULI|nr:hypothetical protein [Gluconacetobacter liquefaciens]MBB2186469.1 hypothetical protein [Gluconacetobacter liquefaciens]RDI38134.1 hypothetical protein C7453_10471 [Gluconacetobacter liquefaciens]GBR09484.1 hypothetical protein AA0522_2341 [Gluconacetobacter liquefaciens NRIC 0522]GEB38330.1 hypothetical protein GLI01_23650 [Gluconacetobacter liquefaciens]